MVMQAADHIRDAVLKVLEDDDEGPFMIGDLVLIAEITPSHGEPHLLTLHNEDISHWKELGLLHDRLLSITQGHFVLGSSGDEG